MKEGEKHHLKEGLFKWKKSRIYVPAGKLQMKKHVRRA
jgi:hypothetical protein